MTDLAGRRIGVFVKGTVMQRLEYRWSLDRPLNRGEKVYGAPPPSGATSFDATASTFSTGGYVAWQFFDVEDDLLPYRQGSYLGSKRVLNVGAGYLYHPRSMVRVRIGVHTTRTSWDST
jgi:hypothetical protein